MPVDPNTVAKFQGIKRFVVLMLENRSFDHLFGYLKAVNPKVIGLTGNESNQKDPNSPADPAIFAAGDCTWHVGREGIPLRLESVQNAIDQAKHAACAMVGRPRPYREVPWFWSDQYDLKLQIAGLARDTDRIVLRGDPATRKFAVFHLREGAIAAVEAVNAPSEYLVGRKLIADGTRIAPEKLADSSVPMKSMA